MYGMIKGAPGTNTVLIMTSSIRTTDLLSEFLDSMDPDKPPGQQGRKMMLSKLRHYLVRQAARKLAKANADTSAQGNKDRHENSTEREDGISAALRKKDKERQARIANRRRIRGGATATPSRNAENKDNPNFPEP